MDPDDLQALAPPSRRAACRSSSMYLCPRPGRACRGPRPSRSDSALHRLVHGLEVRDRVADAVPRLLRLVVDLVPRAEVLDAELAEVHDDPADVAAVGGRRDDLAALLAQVGRGDVQQRGDAGSARGEDELARLRPLAAVLHDVGWHEVARALDVQRPEGRRLEHARALVGHAHLDRAARGGRQRRREQRDRDDDGEDQAACQGLEGHASGSFQDRSLVLQPDRAAEDAADVRGAVLQRGSAAGSSSRWRSACAEPLPGSICTTSAASGSKRGSLL